MADLRSEATLPEQSQGVIRKNKDSLSRAISKHLIFVLRVLSVSLIACLAGGLLSARERNLRKCARSAKSERIPCGRCQKNGGGGGRKGWVGEWKEGKKGNWGERGGTFFISCFSLPPLFAPVMQATTHAPYSASNFGAHLRAWQIKLPATQAKFPIISNCYCILLLSLLAVLPNKGSCTSSSPPAFCFGRRTTNCGDWDALGTYWSISLLRQH